MTIHVKNQNKYQPRARGYKAGTLFEVSQGEIWLKTSNGAVRLHGTPYAFVDDYTLEIVTKFQHSHLSTAVITIENLH